MLLDLDSIINVQDVKTETVDMQAEWGGDIKIRAFDLNDQIEFERKKKDIKDDADLVLLTLKMSIVDENNERIFNDSNINALSKKNSKHLFKLFTACLNLNSLNSESMDENAKN